VDISFITQFLVEYFKRSNPYGRNIFINFDIIEGNAVDTVHPTEIEFIGKVGFKTGPKVIFTAAGAVFQVKIFNGLFPGVKAAEAVIGAEPQVAFIVFQDTINHIVGKTFFNREAVPLPCIFFEAI